MDYLDNKSNDKTLSLKSAFNFLVESLINKLTIDEIVEISEKIFTKEVKSVFSDNELIRTIKLFFENDLNLSETSKCSFLHRNTLVYRLEKIRKITGLNLRKFNDAVDFKIILLLFDKRFGAEI